METQICRYCHNTSGQVGYGIDNGSGYTCPICKEKFINSWERVIKNYGIEYEHFTFNSFVTSKENERAVATCKEFAVGKNGRTCLLLYSPNAGNGKTHLAIATLRNWLQNYPDPASYNMYGFNEAPFKIISEPQLLLEIRATFKGTSDLDEVDIINKYIKTRFLIIDDIGKYNPVDPSFLQRVMFSIIDKRYIGHSMTIITSNKSGAELKDYLGEYTFDRICGMTDNKITEIHGESCRGKHA